MFPHPRDFFDDCIGLRGVQPEHLHGVCAANLHFESATDGHELQMFLTCPSRRNDAESDFGDVFAIPRRFHRRHGARDDGRVPAVELRTFQEAFEVAHDQSLARVPGPQFECIGLAHVY